MDRSQCPQPKVANLGAEWQRDMQDHVFFERRHPPVRGNMLPSPCHRAQGADVMLRAIECSCHARLVFDSLFGSISVPAANIRYWMVLDGTVQCLILVTDMLVNALEHQGNCSIESSDRQQGLPICDLMSMVGTLQW